MIIFAYPFCLFCFDDSSCFFFVQVRFAFATIISFFFFSLARWADSIVPETMQWNNCGLWKYLAMEITFADHTHSIIWIKCKATWMKLIMATASKSFDSLIVFEKLELCDRCYQYCLIQLEKNAKIVVFDCISQCLFANGSKLFLY